MCMYVCMSMCVCVRLYAPHTEPQHLPSSQRTLSNKPPQHITTPITTPITTLITRAVLVTVHVLYSVHIVKILINVRVLTRWLAEIKFNREDRIYGYRTPYTVFRMPRTPQLALLTLLRPFSCVKNQCDGRWERRIKNIHLQIVLMIVSYNAIRKKEWSNIYIESKYETNALHDVNK